MKKLTALDWLALAYSIMFTLSGYALDSPISLFTGGAWFGAFVFRLGYLYGERIL